jgi:hypothetical protein
MRVEMRLVKITAATPDTPASPGQLEADVQWDPAVQAASMMWRECHRLKVHCKLCIVFRLKLNFFRTTIVSVQNSYLHSRLSTRFRMVKETMFATENFTFLVKT